MTSEHETIARDSMTAAYHDHQKGLISWAFFKLNNRMLGEDLVQDTFTKTWKYLVKGGKIETMRAFLYHILNNLIIDDYRKRKSTSLDALTDKGFEPSIRDHGRMIDILDGRAAMLLIQRLPEKYRIVMRMKFVQLLTISEIAILTGLTKNTVTVQLHRGIAKLKAAYGIA